MFRHIMVVFIGTQIKTKAFLVGLGIAKKFESDIIVVDCVYRHPPKFHFFETKSDRAIVEKQKKKSMKTLEGLEGFAQEANVKIKTKLVLTDAVTSWVADYVKSNRIDLLILDHPHEPQYDIDLTSDTVKAIVDKVKVPVLTLRS